jgi:transposase-like protein
MPAHPISDEKQAAVFAALAAGESVNATARRLRVDRGTVSKYKVMHDAGEKPETGEDRRARTRELAREREELNAVAGEKSVRAFLDALVRDAATPFRPVAPPAKAPKGSAKATRFPLLHLSDWHFEEIVKPDAVMGLNEYNAGVACRRVYRVVHAFLDWARTQRAGGNAMPEVVVALNGDMLSGVLHALEKHSSAPNVVRATLACGRLVGLALRDLAANFPRVRVYGTVGNHGRMPDDKKVPTKDPTRSFDYIAYAFARELLRGTKHVVFELPDSYGAVYEVAGHTVYQGHGNFVKQQMGIVGYGMRRFVANLAANMGAAGHSLRYAFFGHFHQASSAEFAGVTAFIGPSLIGTQEYGFLSGGSVNRPAQQCFVFDKELGHCATENFYGEGSNYDGTYDVEF